MKKAISKSQRLVSEKRVSDECAELFHYTDWTGLKGIFESGQLWATRYDCLNDSAEVYEMQKHLEAVLREPIRQHALGINRLGLSQHRAVKRLGGIHKIAEHQARRLVNAFYKPTFQGSEDSPPFAEPFIFSFCKHGKGHEYESKNGLLSQWRGYGKESGYALVFDAKALEGRLDRESRSHHYAFLSLTDVVYNRSDLNFSERFPNLVRMMESFWRGMYSDQEPSVREEDFQEFVRTAVRFKHRAFFEEQEIRIVSCPVSPDLLRYFRSKHTHEDLAEKDLKARFFRGNNDSPRHYIKLFDAFTGRPKINRIIVGPGRDQASHARRARSLVNGAVPVVLSATPFIGQ